jgi:hypothetical protein
VGKETKSIPPWSCNAGPAELDVNGSDVWVHCIDPKSPDDQPRIHFWHSGDAGGSWTRAGALDETIAMGRYAFGAGKLFLTGSVDGKAALLWVLARAGDKWSAASAKAVEWPSDTHARLVASDDGSQLAIVGERGGEMVIAGSSDGGKTLTLIWRGPWSKKTPSISAPSLVRGTIAFPLEIDDGGVAGLVTVSMSVPSKLEIKKLDDKAEDACVFGSNVAVHWSDSGWALSRDGGASFTTVGAPAQKEQVLACSKAGARYGTQQIRWR